jgi:2-oxo-3-hexenedioate decarboxylase
MDLAVTISDLLHAFDTHQLTQLPSERGAFSVRDAYSVGAELTRLRRARGERTLGRKIGFTNRAIWPQYGVESPLWAHMYTTSVLHAEEGVAHFAIGQLVSPRIEAEIVLGLATPVLGNAAPAELAPAIAWVALGFEIVDCHYADWRFTLADCTADFGLHAALVVGPRYMLTASDTATLAANLAAVRVEQHCDAVFFAEGSGANALGSPLIALGFLAETIAALGAESLQAGEIITTGTLTPAVAIQPGHIWRVAADWMVLKPLSLELGT